MAEISFGASNAEILQHFTSDAYLLEIGRVITQWSMMETLLDAAIWQTGGIRNDLGRVFCAQQQVNSKLDTLAALLMQRKPLLGEQFAVVADYVRNCLLGKRNTVAHGFWSSNFMDKETPAIVVKFSAKGRLTSQPDKMTIGDLKQLAVSIAEVTDWLMKLSPLLPKLRQRPGGLAHKSPEPPDPQGCAVRRSRALLPPTINQKEWEARNPVRKGKQKMKATAKQLALANALKNYKKS